MKTTSCGDFRNSGFTLVELIMVIAVAGIVAVMISTVMTRPLQGFADQSRRAELTDLAAMALNRMARDIRLAVPNSLRAGNGALELLRAPVGGRYRANLADGQYQDPPACVVEPCRIPFAGPLLVNELSLPAEAWMVIYNVGGKGTGDGIWPPPDNASSVITPKITINVDGSDLELALSGFRFRYASPQHRFYLADKVIGYSCQNGRLLRAEFDSLELTYNYANAALVVNSVDCAASRFTYDPGTNTRNGLVSLRLTLRGEAGETITLLQQVHVDNAP